MQATSPVAYPTLSASQQRAALLPGWIRFFSWCFIGLALLLSMFFLLQSTGWVWMATAPNLTFFGQLWPVDPWLGAALLIGCFNLHALCAYTLLSGKSWSLPLCLGVGYLSLLSAVATLLVEQQLRLPLQLPLLLIFLYQLHQVRSRWAAL
jgi:hypothetical protein